MTKVQPLNYTGDRQNIQNMNKEQHLPYFKQIRCVPKQRHHEHLEQIQNLNIGRDVVKDHHTKSQFSY